MNVSNVSPGTTSLTPLQQEVIAIAHRASRAIMAVYAEPDSSLEVTIKADDSPLTRADTAAHKVIIEGLAQLTPSLPVLSEESPKASILRRREWDTFWLVDPLDGTRDFIRHNGEFSVNIALVERGVVTLAVIEAPARGQGYVAIKEGTAYTYRMSEHPPFYRDLQTIRVADWQPDEPLILFGSRSHGRNRPTDWYASLPPYEQRLMGSSLKFCEIANGQAHLYVRQGATSEWDTAAGQLVLECAGGVVVSLTTQGVGPPLHYNQRDTLINPGFLACARSVFSKVQEAMKKHTTL